MNCRSREQTAAAAAKKHMNPERKSVLGFGVWWDDMCVSGGAETVTVHKTSRQAD